MPKNKRAVRILNPVDGPGWTSAKKAIDYIKRGSARFIDDGTIEFIADDYRHLAAGRGEPPACRPRHRAQLDVVPAPIRSESAKRRDELGLPNFVGFLPKSRPNRRGNFYAYSQTRLKHERSVARMTSTEAAKNAEEE